MTNYIDEMMRTAGCKQQYCGWLDMGDLDTQYQFVRCDTLEEWNDEATFSRTSYSWEEDNEDWRTPELKYPDFTAEKQLEMIKLLLNGLSEFRGYKGLNNEYYLYFNHININHKDFAQALAQLTTELMNTGEPDKQKVKEILEG